MRPFVELRVAKEQDKTARSINPKNLKKTIIFGGKGSVLNDRLLSFRFEESDGDDIDTNRKGRKDIVEFTFLDEVSDQEGFLTDKKVIEMGDLLFVRYGWILRNSSEKVQPDLVEREFRIVKIEPKFGDSVATATVTAYDRSYDLDKAPVGILFEASKSNGTDTGPDPASRNPFKLILSQMAQSQGLVLDQTSRVIFEDDFLVKDRLAVPGETIAAYLRYLAEETGSQFYVENRRLFFGARRIPNEKNIVATISRKPADKFVIESRKSLRDVPAISINIEQKLSDDSLKYSVTSQDKRKAQLDPATALAQELDALLLIFESREDTKSTIFPMESPLQMTVQEAEISIQRSSDPFQDRLDAQSSVMTTDFFKDPRLIDVSGVWAAFRQPTPSLREKSLKLLVKKHLQDLAMKDITATVKILGNPLIRHGQMVKLDGKIPNKYRAGWYVQSVEHKIDGSNYFTTLKLCAASPDNPLLKRIKTYGRKLNESSKKKKQEREIEPIRTSTQ